MFRVNVSIIHFVCIHVKSSNKEVSTQSSYIDTLFSCNSGYYFMQLFSHGLIAAEPIKSMRMHGPISFADEKISFVDSRIVNCDSEIHTWYMDAFRHFVHFPVSFETSFPWLRLLLIRNLETIYADLSTERCNLIPKDKLARFQNYLMSEPNKDNQKIKTFLDGLLVKNSMTSEILQSVLARTDPMLTLKNEHSILQNMSSTKGLIHRELRSQVSKNDIGVESSGLIQARNNKANEEKYATNNIHSTGDNNIILPCTLFGGGNEEEILARNTRKRNR